VLEFWSELHARRACDEPQARDAYKQILFNVADFDVHMFAGIYHQASQLRQAGMLELDNELRDTAELILSDKGRL
jgi:hypothetical protein